MKIFNNINIPKNYKISALAIGNFDGVHKGHQKVIKETKKFAKRKKIKFGVLTFTPLPIMFFYKNVKNFRLASEDQKIELFKKHQVDFVINIKFNKKFSKISAKDFIKKIIYKKMNPQSLSVSNNFRFGRKRKGDVNLLKKFSNKYDYRLLNINPFQYSGKIVSSTRIRKCLKNGKIDLANKLLSRTWFIEGQVKKGKKIGRKLGYRTCNIEVKNYILPKIGIYAVKISVGSKKKKYGGVAYLGSRPTFGGNEVLGKLISSLLITLALFLNLFLLKLHLYSFALLTGLDS